MKLLSNLALRILQAFLLWVWALVDSLMPPWIRSFGGIHCCIWILCILYDPQIVSPYDDAFGTMGLVANHKFWLASYSLVLSVCVWSLLDYENIAKRLIALTFLFTMWYSTAFLIFLNHINRPMGWYHVVFGTFAFLAFWRPVLRDFFAWMKANLLFISARK